MNETNAPQPDSRIDPEVTKTDAEKFTEALENVFDLDPAYVHTNDRMIPRADIILSSSKKFPDAEDVVGVFAAREQKVEVPDTVDRLGQEVDDPKWEAYLLRVVRGVGPGRHEDVYRVAKNGAVELSVFASSHSNSEVLSKMQATSGGIAVDPTTVNGIIEWLGSAEPVEVNQTK